MFVNLKMSNIHFFKYSKRWAPTNPADPCHHILKFLDMRSISVRKHEVKICKYLKPINQTKKPRDRETKKPKTKKPRNHEANIKKPRNQDTKKPPTPQHTDSHPWNRPPSWGTRGSLEDTSGTVKLGNILFFIIKKTAK